MSETGILMIEKSLLSKLQNCDLKVKRAICVQFNNVLDIKYQSKEDSWVLRGFWALK